MLRVIDPLPTGNLPGSSLQSYDGKIRKHRHWETEVAGISWVLNPKVFNVSIHLVLDRVRQLII